MHQEDFSILKRMKINTDVIIANQANYNCFATKQLPQGTALMITTTTRGLSKNRNIGLEFVDRNTDYVLFADDDLVFVENYLEKIVSELESHPEADAVKFNLTNLSKIRKISMTPIMKWRKASLLSVSSSGVWGMVIRMDSIIKYNLRFNEYFGAGTENYCGEDTIFLQEIIKKGIKMYLSPLYIAGIDQSNSTWFEGFNKKYFMVGGMVLSAIYPKIAYLIAFRSAYKFSRRENVKMKFLEIFKAYLMGINKYKR